MNLLNLADHPERGVAVFALAVWIATIGQAIAITYG